MSKYWKALVGVLAVLVIVLYVTDKDDVGGQLEEAANDAGRQVEDLTEEAK